MMPAPDRDLPETLAWLPIGDAPRDGTKVLLLYASGLIVLGRWEHAVRTINGRVVSDNAGWSLDSAPWAINEVAKPVLFAALPPLPERDEHGYIATTGRMEAPGA